MSLTLYKKKRSFKKTPSRQAKKKSSSKSKLRFVVQKHDATQLHYDFRLEMEGVLKSWAVPKGPSLNPDDKRLAMMVEDHPYDYRTFEGTIPEGNYGAGTVMVWDEEFTRLWITMKNQQRTRKIFCWTELKKGDVKIVLHGEKLKGAFALVKIHKVFSSGKDHGENAWLLIKKKDDAASEIDITKKDKSVRTKRSLAQIAKDTGGRPRPKAPAEENKTAPQLLE
jgi:bifunctional non-homologous end joining protein LigD